MDTQEVIEKEKRFVMQSYGRLRVVFEHGEGTWLFDKEGKKYLDLVGAIATCSVGYANSEVNTAIKAQLDKLINTTNLYYTEAQVELAEKLAQVSGLQKSFFCNSGTEAMETAIKLARKHTGKKGIIACEHGFHGRTLGALSATWKQAYKEFCSPLVPGFSHIPYDDAEALRTAITPDTAAFIVEPIQGEAGVMFPKHGYLRQVREICDEKGVLLIVDEVQTNLRTGKFFAFQHEKILPDIVGVAKGIANGVPLGVTLAREGIDFTKGQQGSTFGGSALACAAGLATIGYIQKHGLVEQAVEKGKEFFKGLEGIKMRNSSVAGARGRGLMLALDLDAALQDVKEVVKGALGLALVLNSPTGNVLRFLPPLTISDEEIRLGLKRTEEAIQRFGMKTPQGAGQR